MFSKNKKNNKNVRKQVTPLVTSSKTVFVKSVPADTTDKELTKLFSQFGRVVKCFTVGENTKRGKENPREFTKFAFVTFSNDDEVTRAINRKLVKLKEHTLLCLPAKRRLRQQIKSNRRDDSENELFNEEIVNLATHTDEAQAYHSSSDNASEKEEAIEKPGPNKGLGIQARSLVMSGLPVLAPNSPSEGVGRNCGMMRRVVDQFISGLESIEPLPQPDNTLLLTFSSKHLARKALALLRNLSWGGGELEVSLASLALLDASAKHQKKSKLLVRNLSFKCSLDELRKSFEKYGKVIDVHIPQKPGTDKMLGFGFVTMSNIFEASAALNKLNGSEIMGRKVAVDWALDRKAYLSQKQQEVIPPEPQLADPISSDELASQSDVESLESESDPVSDQMDSEQTADSKPRRVDSSDGKCLFLRNLPFSLDEEDLTEYFSDHFGAVQYAKLVTNRETGMLTGNGFVRFMEESTAEDCLSQSEQGISIEGRTIEVMKAVTKEEASVLTGKRNTHKKEDKRNLKMASIGSLDPKSEAYLELPKADQVKRARAEAEKKEKLNNPNIFVSRDRLSIRNLPLSIGDKELRALSARFLSKGSSVKSAKVMRDMNRLEKGVGRSKGFGFVGFSSHEAAMTVLKALNNNPDVLPNKRRLIVELSLENQRAIKVKESRLSKSKLQLQKLNEERDSNATPLEKEKSNKFNKRGIGKVLSKKNRTQLPHVLGKKLMAKNTNNTEEQGTQINNKSNQKSSQSNNNSIQSKEPRIASNKLKKSKRIPAPSRREKKRKLGERESKDEKRFEELVRLYQKKLFKVNT